MIAWINSGLKFCANLVGDGKAVDALNIIVDEFDKRRMIDYGRLQVKDASAEKLKELINQGLTAKRDAIRRGAFDDGYRRGKSG